jgi:glucosamine--fructose-6-phosphate aminotransferase (isomerizing)
MCGIVGVFAKEVDVIPNIMSGLKKLEYRGYDSAGVAVITSSGISRELETCKTLGNVDVLNKKIFPKDEDGLKAPIGIGHLRWATHGGVTLENAHPIVIGEEGQLQLALVHNGIIENHNVLRKALLQDGVSFKGQTDTEVVANCLYQAISKLGNYSVEAIMSAVSEVIAKLEGQFAIAMIFDAAPDMLIGFRRNAPLVLGMNDKLCYIASDAFVVHNSIHEIQYLEDNDIAIFNAGVLHIQNQGVDVTKQRKLLPKLAHDEGAYDKLGYNYHMLKEIYEQPKLFPEIAKIYFDKEVFEVLKIDWPSVKHIHIIACGTAFYAGCVGKYWLEHFSKINTSAEIASEFLYRSPVIDKSDVCLFISQSGETADTLAAMKYAKSIGVRTVLITNVPGSSMTREADFVLHTKAGIEIGVAATKTFFAQLIVLCALVDYISAKRDERNKLINAEKLDVMHAKLKEVMRQDDFISKIAEFLQDQKHIIFLGRNVLYPIALEGALKMKEITYISAEGLAAGELKHGPIAIVEEGAPVIVLAPYVVGDENYLFSKIASNIQEVQARGAKIILVSTKEGCKVLENLVYKSVIMPEIDPWLSPILYCIPMQLMAYYTALRMGLNIDQPRNLAKSVTVE